MGMYFDLRINGQPIGGFEAVRTASGPGGGTEPDDVNLYEVQVHEAGTNRIVGEATDVEHRYGDGAYRLVQRGLDALFGPAPAVES